MRPVQVLLLALDLGATSSYDSNYSGSSHMHLQLRADIKTKTYQLLSLQIPSIAGIQYQRQQANIFYRRLGAGKSLGPASI